MIKYQARTWGEKIKVVNVERETASSVWIDGRRYGKKCIEDGYFDTFQDAKDFLLAIAEKRLKRATVGFHHAQDYMGNVKGLKPE